MKPLYHHAATGLSVLEDVLFDMPDTFTFADMVVACWQRSAETFGIPGYYQYPCSRRVANAVFGKHGAMRQGWLKRAGKQSYEKAERFRPPPCGKQCKGKHWADTLEEK